MGKGDTKARSKGEAKRAKRGRPRTREYGADDKPIRSTAERQESVMSTALNARCRLAGLDPDAVRRTWGDKAANTILASAKAFAKLPWSGCAAGRAIAGEDDVVALWEAVKAIRAARLRYLRAIGAPSDDARAMRLPIASGEGGDDDSDRRLHDLPRTEEERDQDARDLWEALAVPDLIFAVVIKNHELLDRPRFARALRAYATGRGWMEAQE